MKVTVILIINDTLGTVSKGSMQRLKLSEIGGRVETIQTTVLFKIGCNTEESPRGWMGLAFIQILVRNYRLVWKTRKGVNNSMTDYKVDNDMFLIP